MIKEAQVEAEESPEGSEPVPMKNVVTKIAEKLKDRLVVHLFCFPYLTITLFLTLDGQRL